MQDSMELFARVGITCPEMEEKNRKLVFENREAGYRFIAVRATDVPT
jgi:ATP phosphoribosyltransferase